MPNFLETGLSKLSRDNAIFRFSNGPPPPSWIFEITQFYRLQAVSSPVGFGADPQPKSNLVHFSLKI